jgi:hypothetical protein
MFMSDPQSSTIRNLYDSVWGAVELPHSNQRFLFHNIDTVLQQSDNVVSVELDPSFFWNCKGAILSPTC